MIGYFSAKEMIESAQYEAPTRNFSGTIFNFCEDNAVVETDLFDKKTLRAYAKKSCNSKLTKEEESLFEEYKGGSQGDYSSNMALKINNVVECLAEFQESKRAVIMINSKNWHHYETDDAKCCRELHFYLDRTKVDEAYPPGWKLSCTGFFRAQAVDIMPKNFYFVYYVMNLIKEKLQSMELNVEIGNYTHFVTTLVATRND